MFTPWSDVDTGLFVLELYEKKETDKKKRKQAPDENTEKGFIRANVHLGIEGICNKFEDVANPTEYAVLLAGALAGMSEWIFRYHKFRVFSCI